MAANYKQPATVEKRVRFFDGQFLQDQDFIDEQKYHIDRQRRHGRLLHVAGIMDGLIVSKSGRGTEPPQVLVSAGTAIDQDGRQLALAEARAVDLPLAQYKNATVNLYLRYQEVEDELQTEAGSEDYRRWWERPEIISVAAGESVTGDFPPVLLAAVTLDENAIIGEPDTAGRQYSGLRLPGPKAQAATLRSDANGRISLEADLVVSGAVGIDTANPQARLDVEGNVKYSGTLSKLDVAEQWGATLRAADFTLGHSVRRGSPGRALVDGSSSLIVNYGSDWPATEIHGESTFITGKLGIGTANPASKLTVSGGDMQLDGNRQIAFTDTDTSNNLKLQLWSGFGLGINHSTLFYAANGFHSWRDGEGANERMVLNAAPNGGLFVKGTGASSFAGSLGIGTANPGSRLTVSGGDVQLDGNRQVIFTETDTSNHLKLQLWSGYGLGINHGTLFYAAGGLHSWRDGYGTNERMALSVAADGGLAVKGTGASSFAGKLGIGTTNPQARLDVEGDVRYSGTLSKLDVAEQHAATVRAADFGFGHAARRGSPGRALVDNSSSLILNFGADWPTTEIHGATTFIAGKVGIGTAAPDHALHVVGTVLAGRFVGDGAVPAGVIVMWSGTASTMPGGWALCDGREGRPDLRDRFVVGSGGGKYTTGNTGGADSVALTVQHMPRHNHSASSSSAGAHQHHITGSDDGWAFGDTTRRGDPRKRDKGPVTIPTAGAHTHTITIGYQGSGQAHENRPLYYAVAFIIKL